MLQTGLCPVIAIFFFAWCITIQYLPSLHRQVSMRNDTILQYLVMTWFLVFTLYLVGYACTILFHLKNEYWKHRIHQYETDKIRANPAITPPSPLPRSPFALVRIG